MSTTKRMVNDQVNKKGKISNFKLFSFIVWLSTLFWAQKMAYLGYLPKNGFKSF